MQLKQLVRKVNVRTRLLAAFLFVSIAPAVLIGIFAYSIHTRSVTEKLAASEVQTIRLLDNALATELAQYEMMIDAVSTLEEVQLTMEGGLDGAALKQPIESIVINSSVIRSKHFCGLRVVNADGQIVYDSGRAGISEDEFAGFLQQVETSSSPNSLRHIEGSPVNLLTFGRKIYRFPLGQKHIGYIFVFISDLMPTQDLFNTISFGGGGSAMLLSADGTMLAGNMAPANTSLADTALFKNLLDAKAAGDHSFVADANGVSSLVAFSYNVRYNTYLLATIPLSYVNAEARQTGQWVVVLVAAAALLCVTLSLWISNSIALPINRIVARCKTSGAKNVCDDSPDEIGFLARTIDQYATDLKTMSRRKRDLELAALQYQINPHFLFNTLGALKWVAIINDAPPVISTGIASLSQLLESVLLNQDDMVTVRKELEDLAHYITIMKIRYADCFEVVNEIDETLLDRCVPRFILQPLVENAISHGSEGGGRRVVITICCKRVDNGVLLEIRDDGSGFDSEAVKSSSDKRFFGIGISNVNERLKLSFGQEHGLDIQSKPNQGTVCRVLIPDDQRGAADV